jgi:hypothetical protein
VELLGLKKGCFANVGDSFLPHWSKQLLNIRKLVCFSWLNCALCSTCNKPLRLFDKKIKTNAINYHLAWNRLTYFLHSRYNYRTWLGHQNLVCEKDPTHGNEISNKVRVIVSSFHKICNIPISNRLLCNEKKNRKGSN